MKVSIPKALFILAVAWVLAIVYGYDTVAILALVHGGPLVLFPLRWLPVPIRIVFGFSFSLALMYYSIVLGGWGAFLLIGATTISVRDPIVNPARVI